MADGRIADLHLLDRKEGALELRFVRDVGFPVESVLISIDGALVADFWEREALAVWLPPGRHRVTSLQRLRPDKQLPIMPRAVIDRTDEAALDLEVAPGPVACIRIAITGKGPRLIHQSP